MEYADERVRDLLRAHDEYKASVGFICMPTLYKTIVSQPAPRFYTSAKRASVVVSRMLKGDTLEGMRPLKQAMFREIYRRVMELRESRPGECVYSLCLDVVEQPAPCFYLSPGSAKILICKARKQWIIEKKLKRLRLYGCL